MIGYLEGNLRAIYEDRVLLLTNQIGYEIMLPGCVMQTLQDKDRGEAISLFIYHYQTERQPRPTLIGFNTEDEKIFFQKFISVEDMGPMKAVKAMNLPINQIAGFIENKDSEGLQQLKGVGKRMAMKIIAALSGTMQQFIVERDTTVKPFTDSVPQSYVLSDLAAPVVDVLVNRLGLKLMEARKKVAEALNRNSQISSPEELFDEVYKI